MNNYEYTTTDKSQLSIPAWAREKEVGETLTLAHPDADEPFDAEIIGFSIREEVEGCPVIDGDDTPFETPSPQTFAVQQSSIAGAGVDIEGFAGIDEYIDVEELVP